METRESAAPAGRRSHAPVAPVACEPEHAKQHFREIHSGVGEGSTSGAGVAQRGAGGERRPAAPAQRIHAHPVAEHGAGSGRDLSGTRLRVAEATIRRTRATGARRENGSKITEELHRSPRSNGSTTRRRPVVDAVVAVGARDMHDRVRIASVPLSRTPCARARLASFRRKDARLAAPVASASSQPRVRLEALGPRPDGHDFGLDRLASTFLQSMQPSRPCCTARRRAAPSPVG